MKKLDVLPKSAESHEIDSNNGQEQAQGYEKPVIKTLDQKDVLSAVNKGSKFPARGFAG